MESVLLFKPQFTGQRFEDHTLPFELLDDLSVYQELLLQVAKDLYYSKNNAKRVPKGFGQNVYLKLSELEQGSTITKILLAASSFFINDIDTRPYFESAHQQIVETMHVANSNGDITNMLSPSALAYFQRFGRDLRSDEGINFPSSSGTVVRFNQENRRKIALSSPKETFVESPTRLRGSISGLDKDPYKFFFLTKEKNKFTIEIDKEWFNIIEDAVKEFESDKRVLVVATGVYNKQNKLEQVKDVESIAILHEMDVPTCLERFLNYEKGWMNGEGEAFSKTGIKWLSDSYDNFFSPNILLPYTFPTVDAGVQFEWIKNSHDATLEVDISKATGYFHYYNSSTKEEKENDFDLKLTESWYELISIVSEFFKI